MPEESPMTQLTETDLAVRLCAIANEITAARAAEYLAIHAEDQDMWYRLAAFVETLLQGAVETTVLKLQDRAAWRPIETAPKNKTFVSLGRLHSDGTWTYGHGYYMPLVGWICWECRDNLDPTHFAHLPSPPQGDAT